MSFDLRTEIKSQLEDITFKGRLTLIDSTAKKVKTNGFLTLKNSKVKEVIIIGSLRVKNSEVEENITCEHSEPSSNTVKEIAGFICVLEDSTAQNVILKDRNVIHLKGHSIIKGNIVFQQRNGKVIVSPESTIQGDVQGGIIEVNPSPKRFCTQ